MAGPDIQSEQITLTATRSAQTKAINQDQLNFAAYPDWRVRLALSPAATYLYKATTPGILQPLKDTDGVIFPYTPAISVNYAANYNPTELVHNNYKVFQYSNSSVDNISLTCDFTAQDTHEANYLLAVIHFFKSMTKMFYGQDQNPQRGTPPPLCYIYGLGAYQFSAQPLAISGFTYSLPNEVDYIYTTGTSAAGAPQSSINPTGLAVAQNVRLGAGIAPGGVGAPVNYPSTAVSAGANATYVPTKIQMTISCVPMMSRNAVSNKFSLKDYATGALVNGTRFGLGNYGGGGFW